MSGIFGVVSKNNINEDLFYGVDYHTHLGTEYGGVAVLNGDGRPVKKIREIRKSQFKAKFHSMPKKVNSNAGIGVISDKFEQPLTFNTKFGVSALVTGGLVLNNEQLAKKLIDQGISFSEISKGETNTVELVAKLINLGKDIPSGINKMFEMIEGSTSLLLLCKEGIYAARDKFGRTALVIGEKDGSVAVTSETCAFPNLGYKTVKFMEPGEIVLLTKDGLVVKEKGNPDNKKICTFLWVYTGYPASDYEGINTDIVRENCGRNLAIYDKGKIKPDMIAGVPDSGIGHAIGYSVESKCPYRRPLVKYTPGYGRSYTPPSQEQRDRIALMKLIPNESVAKGKSIVLCDDSIVRGTQLKNFTIKKLRQCGAREVHARIACPPLMFPCKYNLSTRTTKELIARRMIRKLEGKDIEDVSKYLNPESDEYKQMVELIRQDIGVESLKYHKINDLVKAVGMPKEKLCTHCWLGD